MLDLDVLTELGESEKIGEPKALETKEGAIAPHTVGSSLFYGGPAKTEPKTPTKNAALPSPYQSRWTIKARVTSKSDMKHWHNKNGEGKLFSVNLLDNTGEIKATSFNDQAETFYELLQEGSVYYITTPCRVGFAKKQFSNLNNDYELSFEQGTIIEKVGI